MRAREDRGMNLATVVDETYSLWLWLDARVMDFPVAARREHGRHVLDAILALLEALTRAQYARGTTRLTHLEDANARVALLRLLVRGARELHRLSPGQHEHASVALDTIGRQVGAWRRSTAARTP
jgi:hypothetical protein